MPKVNKNEVLSVVQALWGGSHVVDELAKLALAEHLIREAWESDNRGGIEVNLAGNVVKAALGNRWQNAGERQAAGKPALSQLLGDDPYFELRHQPNHNQPVVKLRISRLAKLINNPELIAEYRAPAGVDGGGSSAGGQQQLGGAVSLTDDGLPIRPGQRSCPHYIKFGWCLFKQDCWYSHPPNTKRGGRPGAADANGVRLIESDLEPGVMLINGVYPIRPGSKPCAFFLKNGYCAFKAKCRHDHPLPNDCAALQPQGVARVGALSPSSDDGASSSHQDEAPMVKQPPLQVLLGVIIDSVWKPHESAGSCAKGALAKHIADVQQAEVQRCLLDREAEITVPGSSAGSYLSQFWQRQTMHNPSARPYKQGGLADMLEEDALFSAQRTANVPPTFTLKLGQLITEGARAASRSLANVADAVWPPNSGKDAWLRGTLAKWLLQAGFEGNNGEVLRQVLAVGPDSPTVFRIDVAQAGEYLLRCWATLPHPYDSSSKPWIQLKPLIADDKFFYIEQAPGRPTSQHVTLDLLDMLRQLPRLRSGPGAHAQHGTAANGASANGAGLSLSSAAFAGASSISAAPQGASTRDVLELELDDDEAETANTLTTMLQASTAAEAAVSGASGISGISGAGQSSGSSRQQSAEERADAVRADIAALEALRYAPPPEGTGPRRMQRWWPRNKPEQQGWGWAEVAVRMLSPEGPDAGQRVAEMVQHLEISPMLAVACSTYASRPHLLQFFAPYASIGGLEMPAAVYLLDIMQPREDVRNYLSLVAPVLNSRDNIKICHSSKQWVGLVHKFGLHLDHYVDTQQANYVYKCLLRESGRRSATDAELKRTAEVSLSALLDSTGFFHPVRHVETTKEAPRLWQQRPLSNELIACAAADVAYLIPLMETQVRQLRQAAHEVRQHQSQQRGRAAQLNSLPSELSEGGVLAALAAGVEGQQRGGLSFARLAEWASMQAFQQVPWHGSEG